MSKIKLHDYQIPIVKRFEEEDTGALFMDVGTGKTFTTIAILMNRIQSGIIEKALIIGPSVVVPNWEKEFAKIFPDCPVPIHTSIGSGAKRKSKLKHFLCTNKTGIVVTNYEVATSSLGPMLYKWGFDTLVTDESHSLKNHKSKRFKFFSELRKKAKRCFILTGTPIANALTDAWAQFFIMDLGESFGKNFYVHQRMFMEDINERWKGSPNYFPKWVVRPDMIGEFKEILSRKSVTVSRDDVLDIPELTVENYYVSLTKEQEKHYNELKKALVTELKGELITVENALTKMLRLIQICSGHLPLPDETVHKFKDIEKIKVVQDIVQSILERNGKVIIWTVFKHDVELMTKALKEIGIHNIAYITGAQSAEEKAQSEYEFQNNPEFKVIVCNLAAANAGINLQQATDSINFSRDFSFIKAYQSEARNRRSGSEIHDEIVQHNIITLGTVEEEIVDILVKKRELGDNLLSHIDNIDKVSSFDKEAKRKILDKFLNGEI